MRRVFLSMLLAVSLVGFVKAQQAAGEGADTHEEVKKEVLKVNEELNQALQRKDTDALGRILADGVTYTNERGDVLSKAQWLASIASGGTKLVTLRQDDIRVHVFGNTITVTGRSTLTVVIKGKISQGPRRFTRTYIGQGGVWRLAAQHVSLIPTYTH